MPRLILDSGTPEAAVFELGEGSHTFGRREGNSIVILLPFVPGIVASLFTLYFLLVEARLLGMLYWTNSRALGWFERSRERSAFTLEAARNCGTLSGPGPMECGLTNPARAGRQQR